MLPESGETRISVNVNSEQATENGSSNSRSKKMISIFKCNIKVKLHNKAFLLINLLTYFKVPLF